MEYPDLDLINKDRTWRTMVCLNLVHETVKFDTNDVGDIKCPTCKSVMVVVVKPVWIIIPETE